MGFIHRTEALTTKQSELAERLLSEHLAFCKERTDRNTNKRYCCGLSTEFSAQGDEINKIEVLGPSCFFELREAIKKASWIDDRSSHSFLDNLGHSTPFTDFDQIYLKEYGSDYKVTDGVLYQKAYGDEEFIEVTDVMGVSLAHGAVLLDTINRIFKTEFKLDEFDGR